MPYFILDEDGNKKEVPVRYVRSSDYKTYYAHGARGGILGAFHFRVDFYRDDLPPTSDVVEEGGLFKYDAGAATIKREIDLSVYMPLPLTKQVRDWLDPEIKGFEEKMVKY